MNKLLLSLLMIVLIASMTLVACSDDDDPTAVPTKTVEKTVEVPGATVEVTKAPESVDLDLHTSKLGGTLYANALALSMTVTKNSDLLEIDPVSNAASTVILGSFATEDPSDIRSSGLGIAITSQYMDATIGTGREMAGPAYTTGMPIMYLSDVFIGWASIDDDINTVADMDGKKVRMMYAPVGPDYALITKLVENAGIEVQESYGSGSANVDELMDGLIDVVWFGASIGEGDTYQFSATTERLFTIAGSDLNILQITEAEMQAAMDDIGYPCSTKPLPANYFSEGIPKADMATSVCQSFVFADETMSEDTAYEFIKTVAENLGSVGQYCALLSGLTAENMYNRLLGFSDEDIHPGAMKYYLEVGVAQ